MHKQDTGIEAQQSALRRAALFIAYTALPVFSVFSGGSAVTFLTIATILLLADAYQAGQLAVQVKGAARLIRGNAPFLLALLFVALGWLSMLWAPWPVRTLHVGFNLAGTLALALVWFQLMRARDIAAIERLILLGIVLAALLLLPALFDILNLRELLVPDHNISKYNRGILILCVFAAVLVALALGSRRAAALGWAALALSAICAFASGSETSKMFLLAFPPLLAVFYLTERVSGWLSAAIPPLFYFAFPLLVTPMRLLLDAAEKAGFENILRESSAMARQEIWASFIAAAMERPILGWGLGSERYVPLAGKALQAGEMGPWTHAHSLPVQVLVHLGLTGFIVAGGVIIAVCLAIKNLPEASRAPAFALATAMLMVWSISHGAWQAWWLAVLVLALAPIFIQARGARA